MLDSFSTKVKKEKTNHRLAGSFAARFTEGTDFLDLFVKSCNNLIYDGDNYTIPFGSQLTVKIYYKDYELKKYYIPDFLVYNEVVVEIKACSNLTKDIKFY